MRRDELVVGVVAAIVAIAGVMYALPAELLQLLIPRSISQQHQHQQQQQSAPSPKVPENTLSGAPERPPRYVPPEVRVRRQLSILEGSRLSPNNVAARRRPALLRDWAAVAPLKPAIAWNATSLRSAFEAGSWGLRNVRGQYDSPVFRLSARQSQGSRRRRGESPEELQDYPKMNDRAEEDHDGTSLRFYDGVPFGHFLDSAEDSYAPYCYYTVPLEDWAPVGDGQLLRDAAEWPLLSVHDPDVARAVNASVVAASAPSESSSFAADDSSSSPPSSSSLHNSSVAVLWLSHPWVTAHTHFDRSHNFLLQLEGSKRVLLWSPAQSPLLYPHPGRGVNGAPPEQTFYHQSQVDFDKPDPLIFPDFPRAAATEAILREGDVLYIPPFWWHRIESLPPSSTALKETDSAERPPIALSLSVVSPSGEEAALAAAEWVKLPFAPSDMQLSMNILRRKRQMRDSHKRQGESLAPGGRGEDEQDVEEGVLRSVRAVAAQTFLLHLLSRLHPEVLGSSHASSSSSASSNVLGLPSELVRGVRRGRFASMLQEDFDFDYMEVQEEDLENYSQESNEIDDNDVEEEEEEEEEDDDDYAEPEAGMSLDELKAALKSAKENSQAGGAFVSTDGTKQGNQKKQTWPWKLRKHDADLCMAAARATTKEPSSGAAHDDITHSDDSKSDEKWLLEEHSRIRQALPRRRIVKAAMGVADLLLQPKEKADTPRNTSDVDGMQPLLASSIARLWLEDYIAKIALWALGPVDVFPATNNAHWNERRNSTSEEGAFLSELLAASELAEKEMASARSKYGRMESKGGHGGAPFELKVPEASKQRTRRRAVTVSAFLARCIEPLGRLPESSLESPSEGWVEGPAVLRVESLEEA